MAATVVITSVGFVATADAGTALGSRPAVKASHAPAVADPPADETMAAPSSTDSESPESGPPSSSTDQSTTTTESTGPTTSTTVPPTDTSATVVDTLDESTSSTPTTSEPLMAPALVGVTVAAVCTGDVPTAEVVNTGDEDIEVMVGGVTQLVTVVAPTWSAPWPITGALPDPIVPWTARVPGSPDTFATGEALLHPDCAPGTVPQAPGAPVATAGNRSVTLTWTAPDDGGDPITDYVVEWSRVGGDEGWMVANDPIATGTTMTFTGLGNGSTYYFRVSAVNGVGTGDPSPDVKAIPLTVPTEPRRLTSVATNLSGQVRLAWTAPVSDGGSRLSDYVVQRSPNGTSGWLTIADGVNTATSYTVAGLTNGARYYFRVVAKNGAGFSPSSNVVNAVPVAGLSAPRSLSAVPGSTLVRLSWFAPISNGGSPVIDYVIQRSPNGSTGWITVVDGVSAATTFTVTGLANGTRYHFRVLARTALRWSPPSNTANAVPRTVPSAPRTPTATPVGSGQIRLTWIFPASNGGSALTDYVIQRSPNGTSGWVAVTDGVSTASSYTVSGLANGFRYYFRISARNSAGSGAPSAVVSAVPRTTPSAPTVLRAVASQPGYSLTWNLPVSTGGVPITDYVVQYNTSGSWTTVIDGVSAARSAFVSLPGYGCADLRVAARNAAGTGAYSYVLDSCFFVPPGTPMNLTTTITWNDGEVLIFWE